MAGWILVTVTMAGAVHRSEEFPTKAVCEVARSLVLTGMTPEENAKADLDYAEQQKAEDAAWLKEHPPRKATPKEIKDYDGVIWGSGGYVKDGMWHGPSRQSHGGFSPSYDPNRGEAVEMIRGGWRVKHAMDIKDAFCVPAD